MPSPLAEEGCRSASAVKIGRGVPSSVPPLPTRSVEIPRCPLPKGRGHNNEVDMNRTRRLTLAIAALTLWCLAPFAASFASAQDWPSRPVKFIVPLGPGSGTDIGARLMAEQLARLWGQSVVVENRAGGDAIVGINAFITAHDSHTLLYMPTSSYVAHPYQHEKLPYDPTELSPVARITNTYVGLVVSPQLNVTTVGEWIAAARARPNTMNYATGTGMTDVLFEAY